MDATQLPGGAFSSQDLPMQRAQRDSADSSVHSSAMGSSLFTSSDLHRTAGNLGQHAHAPGVECAQCARMRSLPMHAAVGRAMRRTREQQA